MVYDELFPLDPAPEGIVALLNKLRNRKAVHEFVRMQLVAGAKVALAFVRIHYPPIDLQPVGRGPPAPLDGRMVEMRTHYAVAAAPAENIIRIVEMEDARVLWQRRGQ